MKSIKEKMEEESFTINLLNSFLEPDEKSPKLIRLSDAVAIAEEAATEARNKGIDDVKEILRVAWLDYFDDEVISKDEFRPIDSFYETITKKIQSLKDGVK